MPSLEGQDPECSCLRTPGAASKVRGQQAFPGSSQSPIERDGSRDTVIYTTAPSKQGTPSAKHMHSEKVLPQRISPLNRQGKGGGEGERLRHRAVQCDAQCQTAVQWQSWLQYPGYPSPSLGDEWGLLASCGAANCECC